MTVIGFSGHRLLHGTCLLLAQSGHWSCDDGPLPSAGATCYHYVSEPRG